MTDKFSDEDEFLTGDEADSWLDTPEVSGDVKLKVENAKSSSATPWLDAIAILEEGIREGSIPEAEIIALTEVIPAQYFTTEAMDAEFDMMAELGAQRNLVNALRSKVMLAGGRGLAKDVTVSEAKSVMDSCRQFGEVIRKNMENVVNLDRIQALESSIMLTVNDYPEDFRREFLKNLEKQLQVHCKN